MAGPRAPWEDPIKSGNGIRIDQGATPTISGNAAVSHRLTAVPGAWSPDGVTLAYQWRRDGSDISGATALTYALLPGNAGHRLSVAVTGTKSGSACSSMGGSRARSSNGGAGVPGSSAMVRIVAGRRLRAQNGPLS